MKTLTLTFATLALVFASAPAAQAADLQTCRSKTSSSDARYYKSVGRAVRKVIAPKAKAYLGLQYTAQWLQPDDAGWWDGLAELREAGNAVWELLVEEGPRINWTGDEGCTLSDAYRTEVTLYADSTAADLRDMREQLAEFGDLVRVTRVNYELDDSVG